MAHAPAEESLVSLLLRDISLAVAGFTLEVNATISGPISVLFGPSGAGKTSLLELIAGLRRAQSAFIQLDDEVLTDTRRNLCVPTRRRHIGYVPQDLALFPHLSVRRNLLYGHRLVERPSVVFGPIIDLLEIRPLLDRGTVQLSGGEKQRVALGRALLAGPRLLLLDEPLANLDLPLKRKILPYLRRIRDELHVPIVYVTHDRFETLSLADQIVVLVEGKVRQSGPTQEVFSRPANLDVADALTVETIQPGRVVGVAEDLVTVVVGRTELTALNANLPGDAMHVHVCIHAHDVILLKGDDKPSSARNHLKSIVKGVSQEGTLVRVELDCGFPLVALLTKQARDELGVQPGDTVFALVKAPNVHLIPR